MPRGVYVRKPRARKHPVPDARALRDEWEEKVVPHLVPDPSSHPDAPGGPCLIVNPNGDLNFTLVANQYPGTYLETLAWDRATRKAPTPLFRAAFCVALGIVPQDIPRKTDGHTLVLRHLCGNPLCCNPAHIAHGSQSSNVADGVAHRPAHTRAVGAARLSHAQHDEIRRLYAEGLTQTYIAEIFGVKQPSVSYIVNHAKSRLRTPSLLNNGRSPIAGLSEPFDPTKPASEHAPTDPQATG